MEVADFKMEEAWAGDNFPWAVIPRYKNGFHQETGYLLEEFLHNHECVAVNISQVMGVPCDINSLLSC